MLKIRRRGQRVWWANNLLGIKWIDVIDSITRNSEVEIRMGRWGNNPMGVKMSAKEHFLAGVPASVSESIQVQTSIQGWTALDDRTPQILSIVELSVHNTQRTRLRRKPSPSSSRDTGVTRHLAPSSSCISSTILRKDDNLHYPWPFTMNKTGRRITSIIT